MCLPRPLSDPSLLQIILFGGGGRGGSHLSYPFLCAEAVQLVLSSFSGGTALSVDIDFMFVGDEFGVFLCHHPTFLALWF